MAYPSVRTHAQSLINIIIMTTTKFLATLHDHVSGKVAHNKPPGPAPVLSTPEEDMLAEWLMDMSAIGYGQSTEQLRQAVKKILDKDGRSNPFTNNLPGYDWLKAFLRRHPKISVRQSGTLPTNRAAGCSTEIVHKWFQDFQKFLKDHDLLDKADRIWNADESGFPLQYNSGRVMAPRGAKTVYTITPQTSSR